MKSRMSRDIFTKFELACTILPYYASADTCYDFMRQFRLKSNFLMMKNIEKWCKVLSVCNEEMFIYNYNSSCPIKDARDCFYTYKYSIKVYTGGVKRLTDLLKSSRPVKIDSILINFNSTLHINEDSDDEKNCYQRKDLYLDFFEWLDNVNSLCKVLQIHREAFDPKSSQDPIRIRVKKFVEDDFYFSVIYFPKPFEVNHHIFFHFSNLIYDSQIPQNLHDLISDRESFDNLENHFSGLTLNLQKKVDLTEALGFKNEVEKFAKSTKQAIVINDFNTIFSYHFDLFLKVVTMQEQLKTIILKLDDLGSLTLFRNEFSKLLQNMPYKRLRIRYTGQIFRWKIETRVKEAMLICCDNHCKVTYILKDCKITYQDHIKEQIHSNDSFIHIYKFGLEGNLFDLKIDGSNSISKDEDLKMFLLIDKSKIINHRLFIPDTRLLSISQEMSGSSMPMIPSSHPLIVEFDTDNFSSHEIFNNLSTSEAYVYLNNLTKSVFDFILSENEPEIVGEMSKIEKSNSISIRYLINRSLDKCMIDTLLEYAMKNKKFNNLWFEFYRPNGEFYSNIEEITNRFISIMKFHRHLVDVAVILNRNVQYERPWRRYPIGLGRKLAIKQKS